MEATGKVCGDVCVGLEMGGQSRQRDLRVLRHAPGGHFDRDAQQLLWMVSIKGDDGAGAVAAVLLSIFGGLVPPVNER